MKLSSAVDFYLHTEEPPASDQLDGEFFDIRERGK